MGQTSLSPDSLQSGCHPKSRQSAAISRVLGGGLRERIVNADSLAEEAVSSETLLSEKFPVTPRGNAGIQRGTPRPKRLRKRVSAIIRSSRKPSEQGNNRETIPPGGTSGSLPTSGGLLRLSRSYGPGGRSQKTLVVSQDVENLWLKSCRLPKSWPESFPHIEVRETEHL